ncbi:hypothetical protein [Leeia aquatica]|uniref:Uncharacterized protein n=1 Tax=Leeia aquatica TaxID=2725557 RepID=A0A847S8X5_9NEIS|nr:hypothetical protein [Leeia aquatica]NLR75305.1 hypothetical protein [Leeia aquatica]
MATSAALNTLYRLADYPVLARLAKARTHATRLDGRACRCLYESALPQLDWQTLSAAERALMYALGLEETT